MSEIKFSIDILNSELERDLVVDPSKLQFEASNNPILYGKWIRYKALVKAEIMKLDVERKKLMKEKLDYYTCRDENEICMTIYEKSELKTVYSADKELLSVDTKLDYYGIMYELTKDAIELFKNRGFAIKNMIDIRMLESGK